MGEIIVFQGFPAVMAEVGMTLIPLAILFFIFQTFFLKLPRTFMRKVVVGMISTFIGLSIFLQGVNIAFLPIGKMLGAKIGGLSNPIYALPVGFILGLLVVLAEPSARVLSGEVEKASAGSIRESVLLRTMASGVAVLVGLGYYFIARGIALTWIIIPGYIIALILLKWVDPAFATIAFDSGAVATGPLTVTFLMSLGLGIAAEKLGGPTMNAGFGLVCLIALASTLAVEGMSFIFKRNSKKEDGRKCACQKNTTSS